MEPVRRTRWERKPQISAAPGPSGPKGEGAATQVLPAGTILFAEGAGPNGVLVPLPPWAKEPAAGAAESSFSCSFPQWKEPKIAGDWLRGVQALQSPVPGPLLRGTLPGRLFFESGAGGAADCPRFRAAAAGRAASRKQSGWTRTARLVPPAVGAGSNTTGGGTPPLRKVPVLVVGAACGRPPDKRKKR